MDIWNDSYFQELRINIWKWQKRTSQLNKEPKRLKKNLEKFRLNRESNPDLCDDRTQRSIHWADQTNWREGLCGFDKKPYGGNDMNGIWNDSYFKPEIFSGSFSTARLFIQLRGSLFPSLFHFHIFILSSKYTKKSLNPFQPLFYHRPKSVLDLTRGIWSSSFNFTVKNGLYN